MRGYLKITFQVASFLIKLYNSNPGNEPQSQSEQPSNPENYILYKSLTGDKSDNIHQHKLDQLNLARQNFF